MTIVVADGRQLLDSRSSGCTFVSSPHANTKYVPGTAAAATVPVAARWLSLAPRFILAFGSALLLPVCLVGLNVAHILPARIMLKGWRIAVILIFVFSAMMTPTPDAWTMLALALPMIGLFFAAVGVSTLLDRRRARREPEWATLADDEASPL